MLDLKFSFNISAHHSTLEPGDVAEALTAMLAVAEQAKLTCEVKAWHVSPDTTSIVSGLITGIVNEAAYDYIKQQFREALTTRQVSSAIVEGCQLESASVTVSNLWIPSVGDESAKDTWVEVSSTPELARDATTLIHDMDEDTPELDRVGTTEMLEGVEEEESDEEVSDENDDDVEDFDDVDTKSDEYEKVPPASDSLSMMSSAGIDEVKVIEDSDSSPRGRSVLSRKRESIVDDLLAKELTPVISGSPTVGNGHVVDDYLAPDDDFDKIQPPDGMESLDSSRTEDSEEKGDGGIDDEFEGVEELEIVSDDESHTLTKGGYEIAGDGRTPVRMHADGIGTGAALERVRFERRSTQKEMEAVKKQYEAKNDELKSRMDGLRRKLDRQRMVSVDLDLSQDRERKEMERRAQIIRDEDMEKLEETRRRHLEVISKMDTSHKAQISRLEKRIRKSVAEHSLEVVTLRDQYGSRVEALTRELAKLKTKNDVSSEKDSMLASVKHELAKARAEVSRTRNEYEAVIRRMTDDHSAEMDEQHSLHSAEALGLKSEVRTLKSELAAAQREKRASRKEIQDLHVSKKLLEHKVRGLDIEIQKEREQRHRERLQFSPQASATPPFKAPPPMRAGFGARESTDGMSHVGEDSGGVVVGVGVTPHPVHERKLSYHSRGKSMITVTTDDKGASVMIVQKSAIPSPRGQSEDDLFTDCSEDAADMHKTTVRFSTDLTEEIRLDRDTLRVQLEEERKGHRKEVVSLLEEVSTLKNDIERTKEDYLQDKQRLKYSLQRKQENLDRAKKELRSVETARKREVGLLKTDMDMLKQELQVNADEVAQLRDVVHTLESHIQDEHNYNEDDHYNYEDDVGEVSPFVDDDEMHTAGTGMQTHIMDLADSYSELPVYDDATPYQVESLPPGLDSDSSGEAAIVTSMVVTAASPPMDEALDSGARHSLSPPPFDVDDDGNDDEDTPAGELLDVEELQAYNVMLTEMEQENSEMKEKLHSKEETITQLEAIVEGMRVKEERFEQLKMRDLALKQQESDLAKLKDGDRQRRDSVSHLREITRIQADVETMRLALGRMEMERDNAKAALAAKADALASKHCALASNEETLGQLRADISVLQRKLEAQSEESAKAAKATDGLTQQLTEVRMELDRVIADKLSTMKAFSEHLMAIKQTVRSCK